MIQIHNSNRHKPKCCKALSKDSINKMILRQLSRKSHQDCLGSQKAGLLTLQLHRLPNGFLCYTRLGDCISIMHIFILYNLWLCLARFRYVLYHLCDKDSCSIFSSDDLFWTQFSTFSDFFLFLCVFVSFSVLNWDELGLDFNDQWAQVSLFDAQYANIRSLKFDQFWEWCFTNIFE